MSKKYAEKLGGQMELKSKWGEGTLIRFTIELHRSQAPINGEIDHLDSVEAGELNDETDACLPRCDFCNEKQKFLLPLSYTSRMIPNTSRILMESSARRAVSHL